MFVSASLFHWKIESLDIASAFLQGNKITRDVFLRPPKGVCDPSEVWKLKPPLYGLNDAPRPWYEKITEELKKPEGQMSKFDCAMFM